MRSFRGGVVAVPNLRGKDEFASIYTANNFVGNLRKDGWDPGSIPHGVIFTYGGFDLLCGAQTDLYSMNPMLGPGPGRFFTANSADSNVGICCMGIGAPAVAAQLEVLISLGVREFLSLGTAGGLHPEQSIGDVVVLTGAVRDEGVSYHYVAPTTTVQPDDSLTAALRHGLLDTGISVVDGSTWTTDAPYRETAEEIAHYREEGVLTVEMEAAAVFAVAEARGVPLASAVVLDAVFGDPINAPTMDTAAAFGKLYDVFLIGIDVLAERAKASEATSA
jgi:uridine phosphorylase